MTQSNHFSARFASKTSEELRQIKNSRDYSEDARLAALWELEKRGESTTAEMQEAGTIKKKQVYVETRVSAQKKYQTFGPRFLAAIIDGLLIGAVLLCMNMIGIMGDELQYEWAWAYDFATDILVYLYYIAMHGRYGQTIGKMAMSVKVVNNKDEKPIDVTQALKRDIVPVAIILMGAVFNFIGYTTAIDLAPFFFFFVLALFIPATWVILEIVTMLMNEKSRAMHDFIAGTVVIRTDIANSEQ